MKLKLAIESDNAAFTDENADGQEEMARILEYVADRVRNYSDGELSGLLRDSNGNTVGSFEFTV